MERVKTASQKLCEGIQVVCVLIYIVGNLTIDSHAFWRPNYLWLLAWLPIMLPLHLPFFIIDGAMHEDKGEPYTCLPSILIAESLIWAWLTWGLPEAGISYLTMPVSVIMCVIMYWVNREN